MQREANLIGILAESCQQIVNAANKTTTRAETYQNLVRRAEIPVKLAETFVNWPSFWPQFPAQITKTQAEFPNNFQIISRNFQEFYQRTLRNL